MDEVINKGNQGKLLNDDKETSLDKMKRLLARIKYKLENDEPIMLLIAEPEPEKDTIQVSFVSHSYDADKFLGSLFAITEAVNVSLKNQISMMTKGDSDE